ncbi:MAG: hypothetical protein RRY12_10780 [Cloacibacillus sp.]
MILDKENMFSNEQTLSAAAVSTNVVDLGVAGDAYVAPWLVVNIAAALTGTLGFELQTSDTENFTATTVLASVAAAARSGTGRVAAMRIPKGAKRYLRVEYKGTVSAGKVTSFLAQDI